MSRHVLRFPRPSARPAPPGLELHKLEPPEIPRRQAAPAAEARALDAQADEPITVLEGGSGRGKTTLLATWFAQTERPAGWLTVDPDDTDPVRFAVHLAAAVHRAQPELARDLHGLCALPRSAEIEVIWAEQFVEPLRHSGARAAVVLDDLHHALAEPKNAAALEWLFSRMPPGLSLLVSSERAVARGRPFPLRKSAPVHASSTTDLDRADPPRELPAALAVPERLCGALVDHLLGTEDGAARLEGLAERLDGVWPEGQARQWYRLQSGLRFAVLAKASDAERAAAHGATARWLFEHGQLAAAVRHSVAGGAAPPLEAWADPLLARGELGALEALLLAAPPSELVLRLEGWRRLYAGAPLSALALVRAQPAEGEPEADLVALRALAAARLFRAEQAADLVRAAPEAPPGTRAAAALDLVAGLLRLDDEGGPQGRLQDAADQALEAGHLWLAFEAARAEIDLLTASERFSEAQDRLQEARAWLDEHHLWGAPFEAALACAEAGLRAAQGRWREVVVNAGRALDLLDALPATPERARLCELMQLALQNLPPSEDFEGDLEALYAPAFVDGHRGVARRLGLTTATARLTVQAVLEARGVEKWWLAWPWRS